MNITNITNTMLSEECKTESDAAIFQFSRGLDGGYLDGGRGARRWHREAFWSVDNVLVFVLGASYPSVSSLISCILTIWVYLGVLSFN